MAEKPVKPTMDYAEASEILRTALKLKGSPVAVGFAATKDDIPADVPEIEKKFKHCQMVSLARNEGRVFYSTAEDHECMGGAYALGLKDLTPTLKTGKFYHKLGKFESVSSSKRTMDSVPHLPTGETFATVYAPLETTTFTPQVIIIVARPWAMLKLAQSSLFRMGGRTHADFSGIQSVCSDSAAETFLTGKPNFSLGCDGSRTFSGITDDEMVMGFPAEMLPDLVAALQVVARAPGSSKK